MSSRLFLRRFLGRKLTFFLRNYISDLAFRSKMIPEATSINRKNGISAMMCTMNEEDWIEPSMLSIKDFVDEYVVIDSSSDQTPKIIKDLADENDLNLILKRIEPGDLVATRNLALKVSEYKWILHWDADFIAKENMGQYLQDIIEGLDQNRYYLIYWPHTCFDGDLFHQNPRMRLHIEHWLFTYSPKLKYGRLKHYDSLIAPLTQYKTVYINEILSFHLRTVRNPVRLLYKSLWYKMRYEGLDGKISLDKYIKKKIEEIYGTSDINKAGRIFLEEYLSSLDKYDKNIFGDYPKELKVYVRRKFGIKL